MKEPEGVELCVRIKMEFFKEWEARGGPLYIRGRCAGRVGLAQLVLGKRGWRSGKEGKFFWRWGFGGWAEQLRFPVEVRSTRMNADKNN